MFLSRFLFIITTLALVSESSFAKVDYEHIVIGRTLSVPGNRLCQDGVFLYFKTLKDCQQYGGDHSCQDLYISPIRQAEDITFDEGRKLISRFFVVNLEYLEAHYEVGSDQVKRVTDSSIEQVPLCDGMALQSPTTVFETRPADPIEENWLNSFAGNGISIINTGFGPIHNLGNLEPGYHNLKRVKNVYRMNIQSPLCTTGDEKNTVEKASGEFSGGGLILINLNWLQSVSGQLIYDRNTIKNNISRPVKDRVYSCIPTVEV